MFTNCHHRHTVYGMRLQESS